MNQQAKDQQAKNQQAKNQQPKNQQPKNQQPKNQQPKNQQPKMLREVALVADRDDVAAQARSLGETAARVLGPKKRSQMTGLETIANGTQRVTDIFNYLKTRTARQKEWQKDDLGMQLLRYLEHDMRQHRDNVVDRLKGQEIMLDDYKKQHVYLLLLRAFIAQVVAHYEYACLTTEKENGA